MSARAFSNAALLACSLVVLGACKGDAPKTEPPPPTPSTPASDAAVEAPAPTAVIDETAVRRRVDEWLAAQNAGDFAAYQLLYADKMEGIKRVGPRMWRFDRARWLADRERMFKRPMKVEATDVAVSITGAMATVELVQTFQQGKFRDRGPKQMVLVAGPGGLRIVREEMLASTPEPTAVGLDNETALRFVIEIDKRQYLVIGKADLAWATGAARGPLPSDSAQYMALRDAGKAPPPAAAWNGRTVTLHGATGHCEGVIESLAVAGGGTPHFSVESRWAGHEESDRPGRPMTKAQQAAEVLGMSELQLVGALRVPAGCDPIYAIGGTPAVYPLASTVDDALAERALAAFRGLAPYKALQAEFEGDYDGKGQWTPSPSVHVFASSSRTFVSVEAAEGAGCGDFNGSLWAMYEVKGDRLVPINDPAQSRYSPHAVLDANGDGVVEIVGQARTFDGGAWYVALTPGEPTPIAEVVFPFTDCGC